MRTLEIYFPFDVSLILESINLEMCYTNETQMYEYFMFTIIKKKSFQKNIIEHMMKKLKLLIHNK